MHSCVDILALCISQWQRALGRGNVVGEPSISMNLFLMTNLSLSCSSGGWGMLAFSGSYHTLEVALRQFAPLLLLLVYSTSAVQVCSRSFWLGLLLLTIYTGSLPSIPQASICPLYADSIRLHVQVCTPHKLQTNLLLFSPSSPAVDLPLT